MIGLSRRYLARYCTLTGSSSQAAGVFPSPVWYTRVWPQRDCCLEGTALLSSYPDLFGRLHYLTPCIIHSLILPNLPIWCSLFLQHDQSILRDNYLLLGLVNLEVMMLWYNWWPSNLRRSLQKTKQGQCAILEAYSLLGVGDSHPGQNLLACFRMQS